MGTRGRGTPPYTPPGATTTTTSCEHHQAKPTTPATKRTRTAFSNAPSKKKSQRSEGATEGRQPHGNGTNWSTRHAPGQSRSKSLQARPG